MTGPAGELAGFAVMLLAFVAAACVVELAGRARRRRAAQRRPRVPAARWEDVKPGTPCTCRRAAVEPHDTLGAPL